MLPYHENFLQLTVPRTGQAQASDSTEQQLGHQVARLLMPGETPELPKWRMYAAQAC
jgi:hypothetical protein